MAIRFEYNRHWYTRSLIHAMERPEELTMTRPNMEGIARDRGSCVFYHLIRNFAQWRNRCYSYECTTPMLQAMIR